MGRGDTPVDNIIKKYNIEVNPDMGKGNRSRIERAMNESANTDKNVKAKKNKVSGAGIFVIIAAILVVIALLVGSVSMVNETGLFARVQTVTQTENGEFSVSGTMMNYFFMSVFNQNYQQMYQMCQQYGLITSTTTQNQAAAYVYSMMGITPGVSLKSQYVDEAKTTTAFDRYMQLTEQYVARLLTGCSLASKYGVALDEKDLEDIEKSLESMKQNYEMNKLYAQLMQQQGQATSYPSSFSKFLTQNYGTGVNEDDIRECMKLMILSSKFDEKLYEEKEAFVESEEDHKLIEEYVKDNPASFLMADYYLYTFTIKSSSYGGSETAEWENAVKEIKEKAEKLAAAEGKEGFKTAVLELLKESEKKVFQEKNWDKYLKEAENDDTVAQTKLDEAFEKEWAAVKEIKYNALHREGYKYPSTATDLSKWIFGYDAGEHTEDCTHEGEHEKSCEAAKEGDIKYFESTTEKEETVKDTTSTTGTVGTTAEETTTEGAAPAAETTVEGTTSGSSASANKVKVKTYTVSVYLLDKETYRDTEITKHIGFVMFEKKEDAQKFLDEYKKLETKDKDSMMDLVEKLYAEMTPANYGAYENYKVGDLKDQNVTGIDEWLEKAEKGNVSDVLEIKQKSTSTSSSSSSSSNNDKTYYGVMVFDGDGYEYWFQQAMVGAANKQVTDWYEENTLKLTFNQGVYILFNPKF